MTSIFDQYEQANPQLIRKERRISHDITNHYPDGKPLNQRAFFYMRNAELTFPSNCRIQNIVVGKDKIVYVTSNNLLFHYNWKTKEKSAEIDIGKLIGEGLRIKNLFLDPCLGCHLLISIFSGCAITSSTVNGYSDLLYANLSCNNGKVRQMAKLKNHEFTAVGWNRMLVSANCSSFILLGTSRGLIFETEINSESEKLFQNNVETYCRQVFDIGRGNTSAGVTGIEFHRFINVENHFFILITTANRLYQFIGKTHCSEEKPVLLQIFNLYLNIPEGFIEIPNQNHSSTLRVYYSPKNEYNTDDYESSDFCKEFIPALFAWHVGGVGVFLGKLNLYWEEGLSSVCIQNRIIDFHSMLPNPISIVLTEFHLVFLYVDRLMAISNINKEMMFVHKNDENSGRYISLGDYCENNIWVLCEKCILRANFIREDRMVWKIYMDENKFSLAKKYCKNDMKRLSIVMKKEAEYYFNCGMFKESASLYAQIEGVSLEEIVLKLLLVNDSDALKLFLYKILDKLRHHESTHVTVIAFWLFEIFEKQFAVVENDEHNHQLENSFKTFLSYSSVVNCMKTNKEIVYKILNSHGDADHFIALANINKDYETMIKYYLGKEDVYSAFNVIGEEPLILLRQQLTDLFLTEFVTMAPKTTVDLLIKLGRNVEPSSLLSSLIVIDGNLNQALEVIRYLEYCVHSLHSRDESIHNYLITLYAKHKPDKLMQYLATQGLDSAMVNYDIRYALKLCQEFDLKEACVQLCSLLGLWENAVDLALSVNLDVAKQTAVQPSQQNTELCKRLWLKIAQKVVHESNDIKKAMEFLQQCDLIKIEDVLPFFSDFVTIDLFKDAICSTLQDYKDHIEQLKEEIDDAISSADKIRSNIQSFKHKYITIRSTDVCCSCDIQLMLRPFYVFPCSHYFHIDCLTTEVQPFKNQFDFVKLHGVQHHSSELSVGNYEDTLFKNSDVHYPHPDMKLNLNEIIGNECFFCGSLTISYIDQPFVKEEEFDKIYSDWQ